MRVSIGTPIVRATLWMFGAILSFSTMAIAGRELSSELTTFQILFYRSLAGFVLMVVLVGFLLLPVVGIIALVLVIIAAIRSNSGEAYRYPFTLRLIN